MFIVVQHESVIPPLTILTSIPYGFCCVVYIQGALNIKEGKSEFARRFEIPLDAVISVAPRRALEVIARCKIVSKVSLIAYPQMNYGSFAARCNAIIRYSSRISLMSVRSRQFPERCSMPYRTVSNLNILFSIFTTLSSGHSLLEFSPAAFVTRV